MFTALTGGIHARSKTMKRILQYVAGLVVFILIALLALKKSSYSVPLNVDLIPLWAKDKAVKVLPTEYKLGVILCGVKKTCPAGMLSFTIFSGVANVVAAKICIENELVLGGVKNNAGIGLNIVVLNGTTGKVVKAQAFNMYSGEVQPLVEFLKSLKTGNIVLMASFDEPATKLNDEARNLITELGSSMIKSVGYRDNWVFVGGKGDTMNSTFEKHIKNNQETNKYSGWPGVLKLEGCIPRFHKGSTDTKNTILV